MSLHQLKKTNCNIKTTEIKNKKPDFGGLVTKVALSTKATKIAKKITNYNRFITTHEFNRLTKINFETMMKNQLLNRFLVSFYSMQTKMIEK